MRLCVRRRWFSRCRLEQRDSKLVECYLKRLSVVAIAVDCHHRLDGPSLFEAVESSVDSRTGYVSAVSDLAGRNRIVAHRREDGLCVLVTKQRKQRFRRNSLGAVIRWTGRRRSRCRGGLF